MAPSDPSLFFPSRRRPAQGRSRGGSSNSSCCTGSSTSRHAPWQSVYQAVFEESDTSTLFRLVEAAEAAVLTRRSELEGSPDHHSERQALERAVADLQVLKKERLKFR